MISCGLFAVGDMLYNISMWYLMVWDESLIKPGHWKIQMAHVYWNDKVPERCDTSLSTLKYLVRLIATLHWEPQSSPTKTGMVACSWPITHDPCQWAWEVLTRIIKLCKPSVRRCDVKLKFYNMQHPEYTRGRPMRCDLRRPLLNFTLRLYYTEAYLLYSIVFLQQLALIYQFMDYWRLNVVGSYTAHRTKAQPPKTANVRVRAMAWVIISNRIV